MDRILEDLNRSNGGPFARILREYGPVAAIAFFLIWFLTARIEGLLTSSAADHGTIKFYMHQVCLNTATTNTQARACSQER